MLRPFFYSFVVWMDCGCGCHRRVNIPGGFIPSLARSSRVISASIINFNQLTFNALCFIYKFFLSKDCGGYRQVNLPGGFVG